MKDKKKENIIELELTKEVAAGVYSNLALIAANRNEFFIDFARAVPGVPKAVVKSRIILNPANTKNLMLMLQQQITQHESKYGIILSNIAAVQDKPDKEGLH